MDYRHDRPACRGAAGGAGRVERIQRGLGAIVARTDPERAHALIALRRELSEQMGRVAALGNALFGEAGDSEAEQAFRHNLATMRAAAAELQASWPAVIVRDTIGDNYRAAVARVRSNDETCMARMRAAIDRIASQ